MPKETERIWAGDPAGQTRKDRESFRYSAYVPDRIQDSEFPLSGPAATATAEAERALVALNADPPTLESLEAVARQLLRAESVASSQIEGLELSHERLARAAWQEGDGTDQAAQSVLGNVRAMEQAVELGENASSLTRDHIIELHKTLMNATRDGHLAGKVRDRQNWLGGSTFSPRGAEFVPPPPEYVDDLLTDLAAFLNREDLPAVQQAAIAHVQFETIHPFWDGNGRVGRCLIHVVLRERGLAPRYVPPISLVLAARADQYIAGLTASRSGRPLEWWLRFANVVTIASTQARGFSEKLERLKNDWMKRAGNPRRDSATAALIKNLPGHPIVDAKTAQALVGGTSERSREALVRLEKAGVLKRLSRGNRNRVWEAADVFDVLNSFERDLATPDGASDPALPVPAA